MSRVIHKLSFCDKLSQPITILWCQSFSTAHYILSPSNAWSSDFSSLYHRPIMQGQYVQLAKPNSQKWAMTRLVAGLQNRGRKSTKKRTIKRAVHSKLLSTVWHIEIKEYITQWCAINDRKSCQEPVGPGAPRPLTT